ncbi:MAG TPA: hypothetical protein VN445_07555 [Rectinemataceae bacterium]|nr:hypothetical protein [Rectinemataceae bacterium]
MPMKKGVVRGVQNIKTLSGRVDDAAAPYKAYMKLSILEMEKYRKNKEKTSALERLQAIDQRFQEIEVEKQKTLQSLETQDISPLRQRWPVESTALPYAGAEPFKIRY